MARTPRRRKEIRQYPRRVCKENDGSDGDLQLRGIRNAQPDDRNVWGTLMYDKRILQRAPFGAGARV